VCSDEHLLVINVIITLCVACFAVQLLVRLRESSKLLLSRQSQSTDGSTSNISTRHNSLLVNDINSYFSLADSNIEITLGDRFVNIDFTSVDFEPESVDSSRRTSSVRQCVDKHGAAATAAAAAAADDDDDDDDDDDTACVNGLPDLLSHYKVQQCASCW